MDIGKNPVEFFIHRIPVSQDMVVEDGRVSTKHSTRKIGRPARIPGEKHTRDKIFDAAVELFSENGYDRTSVRDIAKAVGITESAVYRHYPSKDAILEAIFRYMQTQIYTPLPPVRKAGDYDGGSTIFRDMLEQLPRFIMADPNLVKIVHIMFIEMYHNEKIHQYMKSEYGERMDVYMETFFQKQMDDGKIRNCDPRTLANLFNSFRFSWLFKTFIIDYREPRDICVMERELEAPIRLFETLLSPHEE